MVKELLAKMETFCIRKNTKVVGVKMDTAWDTRHLRSLNDPRWP